MQRVTLIDNYDSFTFNLVHYLGELGAEVSVWRNDKITYRGYCRAAFPLQPERSLRIRPVPRPAAHVIIVSNN